MSENARWKRFNSLWNGTAQIDPRALLWRRILIGFFTLVVVLVAGFAVAIYAFRVDDSVTEAATKVVPYPAALVNNHSVTLHDFYFTRQFTEHFYTASKLTYDKATVGSQILDQLIDQELVVQHALANNVSVSQSEVDQNYQQLIDKSGKDEVNKVLSDLYGFSEAQFKSMIYYTVLKQKLETQLKNDGKWHEVQVRQLLIKVDAGADQKTIDDAKAKAQADLDQIKAGKSFDEIAKANSEDVQSKDQGGELGYVSRGQTVKEFEDAVFAATKGALLGPIRTQYGWHIILIEDIRGDNDYQIWRSQSSIHKLIQT